MDNILGDRFIMHGTDERDKAWHRKGNTFTKDVMSAMEAYERLGRMPVRLVPLQTAPEIAPDGSTIPGITIPNRAIMRGPIPEDQTDVCFGVVGPEYVLITPEQVARIWDEVSGQGRIETMGFLGQGERLFVTRKERPLEIDGDEVEMYTVLDSPMQQGYSAQILITPWRVVCQNTLIAAIEGARERWQIAHSEGAHIKLMEWLSLAFARTDEKVNNIKTAFEALAAGGSCTIEEIEYVAIQTYPDPKKPRRNCPPAQYTQRMEIFEDVLTRQRNRRAAAIEFAQGKGAGLADRAITPWVIYNAMAEHAQYCSSTRGKIGADTLFGERAKWIANAFNASMDLVTGKRHATPEVEMAALAN